MFFSKKKTTKTAERKGRSRQQPLNEFGLPGFSQSVDDDAALEAELASLTGGRSKNLDNDINLGEDDDDLEAELMRIIGKPVKKVPILNKIETDKVPSTDTDDDDEDDEVDENDPELLQELSTIVDEPQELSDDVEEHQEEEKEQELSQVDLLRSRLEAYRAAERKAKESNEGSRARRFNRGVKKLEELLKSALSGQIIPFDEIPPEVATKLKPATVYAYNPVAEAEPAPSSGTVEPPLVEENLPPPIAKDEPIPTAVTEKDPEQGREIINLPPNPPQIIPTVDLPLKPDFNKQASTSAQFDENNPLLLLLQQRRDEFKKLALSAKASGDLQKALSSVKNVKICDSLIVNVKKGQSINEEDIPPTPSLISVQKPRKIQERAQGTAGEIFTIPKTVLEALEQRLNYYTKLMKKAEVSGNRNDIRKCGDIIRIYQNSIKLHKKGSRVPYEKLPTPPGCPPIPIPFQI